MLEVPSKRPLISTSTSRDSGGRFPRHLLTASVQHGHHDGGEPRRLAVGGLELVLEVREEDADAGGEAQRQPLQQHRGEQHHPCPAPVLRLGSSPCSSLGHGGCFLLPGWPAGEATAATMQPSAQGMDLRREGLVVVPGLRDTSVSQTSCS